MPGPIELIILDVDGVLTDGGIWLAREEEAAKRFFVRDGLAVQLWRRAGGRAALLSGRGGEIIRRRAAELGIESVHVDAAAKLPVYERIVEEAGCPDQAVAYVGDDLPDLAPMGRCGFPVAVANAAPSVKRAAAYVTRRAGGDGAVAEVVELLLRRAGLWRETAAGSAVP